MSQRSDPEWQSIHDSTMTSTNTQLLCINNIVRIQKQDTKLKVSLTMQNYSCCVSYTISYPILLASRSLFTVPCSAFVFVWWFVKIDLKVWNMKRVNNQKGSYSVRALRLGGFSTEHRFSLGAICYCLIHELLIFSFIAPVLLSTKPAYRTFRSTGHLEQEHCFVWFHSVMRGQVFGLCRRNLCFFLYKPDI